MKIIAFVTRWFIPVLLGLIPLLFIPLTQEYYDTNKWMVLSLVALVAIATWVVAAMHHPSRASMSISRPVLGLGALMLAGYVSLFVASPNRVEALLSPFGPVTITALFFIALTHPLTWNDKSAGRFLWAILTSATLLSLIAVYQVFGMGKVMFPGVSFLADSLWTPTGSTVATMTILVITLPLLLGRAFEAKQKKSEAHLALLIIMMLTVIAGLGVTLWQLIPRIPGTLLSPLDGWAIMLEILKNPKQALAGVGAENFLAAFSAGRPVGLNMTPLWMVRFTTNANFLFHFTTIFGLLGGAATVLFLKYLGDATRRDMLWVSDILGLLALLLTPPNFSVFVVVTILFLVKELDQPRYVTFMLPAKRAYRIILGVTGVLLLTIPLYFIVRAYDAELTFYQSLATAARNNGTATYNLQVAAIGKNPGVARFHITYSQTNLALASSLAATIGKSGSGVSEEEMARDRDLVAQLIQQSIREAKIAVQLNPASVVAWENLARIYAQLVSVAQGADAWAATSFGQAIALDPTNPALQLEVGSIALRSKNYTEAITRFQRAIALKNNYANAYYNLGNAYRLNGEKDKAIQAMNQAVSLVDKNSEDYRIVSGELEALQQEEPSEPTPTPESEDTTTIIPPLTLPPDSGP